MYLIPIIYLSCIILILGASKKNNKNLSAKLSLVIGLIPAILWIISPSAPFTNVMEVGLWRSQINEFNIPAKQWMNIPLPLNFIAEYYFNFDLPPYIFSAITSILGIYLWFYTYWKLLVDFCITKRVVISCALTLYNPIILATSDIFGFSSPWNGGSTYGMLGIALICFFLANAYSGNFSKLFIVAVILAMVSLIHFILGVYYVIFLTLAKLIRDKYKFSLLMLTIFFIQILILLIFYLEQNPSSKVYSEYLELWDAHRNLSSYQFSSITLAICVIYILLVLLNLRKSKFQDDGFFELRLISLNFIIYLMVIDFSQKILLKERYLQSTADFLLINLMPLRLVNVVAFLLLFELTKVSVIKLINWKVINYNMTQVGVILVLIGLAYASSTSSTHSRNWFSYILWDDDSTYKNKRTEFISDYGLVMASPGHANELIWKFGMPLILNTENGIDFIPYTKETLYAVNQIIEIGYGIEFTSPSTNPRCGCVPNLPEVKEAWESRSSEEWKRISKLINFDSIVTPLSWSLKITPSHRIGKFSVYRIV